MKLKKILRIREYTKHLPRWRDKLKVSIAWLIVGGIPICFKRIRAMMRKILGSWMKRDDMIVDGCRYKLADLDSVYIINPAYEDALKGWFNPKRGEVLVDVGANIGKYTIPFAKRGVKVIAIEPNPKFFDVLQKNIRINRVEANVKAVSYTHLTLPTICSV